MENYWTPSIHVVLTGKFYLQASLEKHTERMLSTEMVLSKNAFNAREVEIIKLIVKGKQAKDCRWIVFEYAYGGYAPQKCVDQA